MISKKQISDVVILVLLFLLLSPFPPGSAWGHRVSVLAYTGGGKVFVEGYFPDGSKAAGAKVEVFDSQGERVFEGLTDPHGSLSFPVPLDDDLTIFVTAAGGHKSSVSVSRDKLEGEDAGHTHDDGRSMGQEASAEAVPFPRELERTLDRKLKPVMNVLLDIRRKMDRPAMRDVVSGLGYVAGIAGLLFFISGRRKRGD